MQRKRGEKTMLDEMQSDTYVIDFSLFLTFFEVEKKKEYNIFVHKVEDCNCVCTKVVLFHSI